MRENKFRAFHKGKFYYFNIGEILTESQNLFYRALCIDGIKFEKFTILNDKNWKEICEGDIVKGELHKHKLPIMGEIVFDEESCAFGVKNHAGITLLYHIKHIEIIGNVNENPELKCEKNND